MRKDIIIMSKKELKRLKVIHKVIDKITLNRALSVGDVV